MNEKKKLTFGWLEVVNSSDRLPLISHKIYLYKTKSHLSGSFQNKSHWIMNKKKNKIIINGHFECVQSDGIMIFLKGDFQKNEINRLGISKNH